MPTTYVRQKLKDENGNYIITPSMADMVYHADGETLERKYSNLQNKLSEVNSQLSDLSIHVTPRMTNDNIQEAIDLAVSLGVNKVILEGKEYILNDTIQVPSNFELVGVKRATVLTMKGINKPIIEHKGSLKGGTILRNFTLRGDSTQLNNDGIKINDFYSTIEGIEINTCGGYGIYWHTEGAGGTLVENVINDVIVRSCGKDSFYLGNANNNKITDGFLTNCISCGNGTNRALYIGSSAGWQINGLHTYGHGSCSEVITIRNAFNTNVSNIYIEDFKGTGLWFNQIQKNLVVNNVTGNIKTNNDGDQQLFRFNHSSAYSFGSTVVVNNVNVECANTGTTYIFASDGSWVKVKASNINLSGNYIPTILYNDNLKNDIELLSNIDIKGSLTLKGNISDTGTILSYNNMKVPVYTTFNFDGSSEIRHQVVIPNFFDYTSRLVRVSLIANRYWDGPDTLYYSAEVLVIRKVDGTYKINIKTINTPSGFSSNPSYSLTGDGVLTIKFTPSDSTGYGRGTIELFS